MADKFGPLQRYVAVYLLLGCALIWVLPIVTNDGPVHVGFANLMSTSAPRAPAAQLYARNDDIHPNFVVYALLGGLLRFFSPCVAERRRLANLSTETSNCCTRRSPPDLQRPGMTAVLILPLLISLASP